MFFDLAHLFEIEDMVSFARKYRRLYIYGCAMNQEYLLKFFDICGINADGYITTFQDGRELCYRQIPKYTLDMVNLEDAGIVIGLNDRYYDGVIPRLRERGFTDYFLMSEHNKRAITHKLAPRPRERMWIEINVADHCNLNCQMCDHFSQLAPPTFLGVDEFRRDMERLAELSRGHIDILKLQGGEPLLHKDICRFIAITRSLFPKSIIFLFTNGLLLMKSEHSPDGNLWQYCKDYDVTVQFTTYPINLNVQAIEDKAAEYGVKIDVFAEVSNRLHGEKHSARLPFDLNGDVENHCFISCYHLNETITLRHGKLYTCSIRPYVEYFNNAFNQNLELSEDDSIDIYKAQSYEELAEFVTRRVPFCRYCDIAKRSSVKWARSNRELSEYVDE